MKRYISISALCLVALVIYSGCKYEPATPELPGKTVAPKAGSVYVYDNYQTDTTGKKIDSSYSQSKDSVVESGITYSGKTNVVHMVSVDPVTGSVLLGSDSYLNFESSGDVSVYTGGAGGIGIPGVKLPDWNLMAVQTHTTVTAKVFDSTITFPGVPLPIHLTVTDTNRYVNTGTYTMGSIKLPIFNLVQSVLVNANAILTQINMINTTHIQYAPSIGNIASSVTDPTIDNSGFLGSQGGSIQTLVSYKLGN
ncbi:MAG: hypothetical protein WCH46_02060 [bacterium]